MVTGLLLDQRGSSTDSRACLALAGPGTVYKIPDWPEIKKNCILMGSGGPPENCPKIVKISKFDDSGGPSENPRKIILGSLNIVKNCQNIIHWATKIQFFDNFRWIREFIESAGAGPLQDLFTSLRGRLPMMAAKYVEQRLLRVAATGAVFIDSEAGKLLASLQHRHPVYPDLQISRYPDIRISGNPVFREFGYPIFLISGNSEVRRLPTC